MGRHHNKNRAHEVTVRCGLNEEYWTTRQEAVDFYLEGALCCGGSEAERYMTIVQQLMAGRKLASDGLEPAGGWGE